MESLILVQIKGAQAQLAQLVALQSLFARACNDLSPIVSKTRCWNRVALHHLAYKGLRERFPQLGSQMACNVIYSVCRAARLVYQHPQSPWNVGRADQKALPVIVFSEDTPVFFDRHTLSIKSGLVSLFTLDGRMRFELGLSESDEQRFRQEKLREISLEKRAGNYFLRFILGSCEPSQEGAGKSVEPLITAEQARHLDLPNYLVVHTQSALKVEQDSPLLSEQDQSQTTQSSQRLRA